MITDSSKFMAHVLRIFAAVLLIGGCLLVLYFVSGCGKTGDPIPRDDGRSFAWEEVDAQMAGKCIAFTGRFNGAYKYFDGVRVEIENMRSLDDCPGCPFVPDEVTELSPKNSGFNPDEGSIAFAYCPRESAAYRWRLAGISVYNRLPHAVMTDRLLTKNAPRVKRQQKAPSTQVQPKKERVQVSF